MMMRTTWTHEDLTTLVERVRVNLRGPTVDPLTGEDLETPDPGLESELQKKIVAHAKAQGWPCLSFRQSKQAIGYLMPGWPDITLCLPSGRVVFIELKGGKGVLKDKQRLMLAMMKILGHEVYIVKSFKRYLQIITERKGE